MRDEESENPMLRYVYALLVALLLISQSNAQSIGVYYAPEQKTLQINPTHHAVSKLRLITLFQKIGENYLVGGNLKEQNLLGYILIAPMETTDRAGKPLRRTLVFYAEDLPTVRSGSLTFVGKAISQQAQPLSSKNTDQVIWGKSTNYRLFRLSDGKVLLYK